MQNNIGQASQDRIRSSSTSSKDLFASFEDDQAGDDKANDQREHTAHCIDRAEQLHLLLFKIGQKVVLDEGDCCVVQRIP